MMMTNAEVLIRAKSIVKNIYSESCTYADIRGLSCQQDTLTYDDFVVSSGAFRSTIIPDGEDFVIKVGMCKGGNKQNLREFNTYADAVAEGVEKFFAKCFGKFRYHNHDFVVFERLTDIGEAGEDDYPEELSDSDWNRVGKFISTHRINDMHYGNYGHRCGTSDLVLSDYAGWLIREDGRIERL